MQNTPKKTKHLSLHSIKHLFTSSRDVRKSKCNSIGPKGQVTVL